MSGSRKTKDTTVERVRVREAAAVFRARERLESAADALLLSGFDRADIDISEGDGAIREHLAAATIPAEELADIPDAPRRPFLAREDVVAPILILSAIAAFVAAAVAAYGVIAAGGGTGPAAIAALIGAAVAGAAIVQGMRPRSAKKPATRSAATGFVLWVRVRSPRDEKRAVRLLRREGGEAIRVHEIEIAKRAQDLPLARLRVDPWLGDEPLGQV